MGSLWILGLNPTLSPDYQQLLDGLPLNLIHALMFPGNNFSKPLTYTLNHTWEHYSCLTSTIYYHHCAHASIHTMHRRLFFLINAFIVLFCFHFKSMCDH